MKISFLSTALALVSLSARTLADVTLGPFPDLIDVGSTYTLSWTATENYTYTLWLVAQTAGEGGYGWSKAAGLDTGMDFDHLEGSYTWTVPANLSSHSVYGLWLAAFAIPFDGSSFDSMTDWFRVSFNNYNTSSTSSMSTASSTSTPTSSPTQSHSSTITLTPTTFPSSTSSPNTSTGSSSSSTHLSGGAIAGIVIGILLLLGLLIGGFIFMKWRNKRRAVQKREAAARDSRLQPVMRVGTEQGDFEMDGRGLPQVNKDFVV